MMINYGRILKVWKWENVIDCHDYDVFKAADVDLNRHVTEYVAEYDVARVRFPDDA